MTTIAGSYSPSPDVEKVGHILDIKSWMGDQIEGIHGHTQPLHFKFYCQEDGKAAMRYKLWVTDPWSTGAVILIKVLFLTATYSYTPYILKFLYVHNNLMYSQ